MNHLPKKFSQVAQIFTKQSKRNVKFSNAGEAVFIKCFTVTDISQSTEYFLVISAKPELKLGQAPWRWTHTEVLYGGVIPSESPVDNLRYDSRKYVMILINSRLEIPHTS